MTKKVEQKAKHGGARIPSKDNLYAYASKFAREAIDILLDMARNARQESVRMAAAGKLLDKSLADLRAIEHTGENNGPILIRIIEEKLQTNE